MISPILVSYEDWLNWFDFSFHFISSSVFFFFFFFNKACAYIAFPPFLYHAIIDFLQAMSSAVEFYSTD